MIGFLIKRIIFLAIFLAAIFAMPYIALFGMVIYFAVLGIRQIKEANEDISLGFYSTVFFVIGGIAVMFAGIFFIDKLVDNPALVELFVVASFSATLIIGGRVAINFVRTDRAYYSMNDMVEKLTAPYPYLLIIAGVARIAVEVIRAFFSKYFESFMSLLDVCVTLGNIFFVVAIIMYVVRTVHVFWENK